jgi:CBS domain containing-hemolysin-like protein
MELHERIEGTQPQKEENPVHAAFWMVIVQIVVLDAVFSLDSVITAVGMVKDLSVMMIAVIIAVGIMLWASKPLMNFVNKHPTVVILCLGFLMMIGFSLIVEGFGFHIPKAIYMPQVSLVVEFVNQTMRRNQEKLVTTTDLRYRTASAVMRMLGGKTDAQNNEPEDVLATRAFADEVFNEENGAYHSVMVQGYLDCLNDQKSVMTPRPELEWLDLDEDEASIKEQLLSMTHSRLIIAR